MRKTIITGASLVTLSAGMAQAGGFELQTLDTSMMYADGNVGSISIADIDASVSGTANGVTVDTVKDQRVTNLGFKINAGMVDVGLYTYRSGAIQLSGGNTVGGNYAPSGDVDINSTTLMASYNLNENISFLGGITQNNVTNGNVTTIKGSYDIQSGSKTGYVLGAAYSMPDIAFRTEVLYQPASKITTKTSYDGSKETAYTAVNALLGLAARSLSGDYDMEVSRPESLTVNLQSGIAADTLIFASYHRAKWSDAPVVLDVASAAGGLVAPKINETFDDSEKFTIGVGRKFSDKLSGSLSYSKEEGSGDTDTSLFTFSNGRETLSAGLRYTIDNMDISVGVSRSQLGDVTVNGGLGDIVYEGNTVTAMGLKIAFAF